MAPLTKEQNLQSPGLTTERVGGPFLRCSPGRQRTHQKCQVLASLQRLRNNEKYGLHSESTGSSGPWWHAANM